jgi:hypothetical protein
LLGSVTGATTTGLAESWLLSYSPEPPPPPNLIFECHSTYLHEFSWILSKAFCFYTRSQYAYFWSSILFFLCWDRWYFQISPCFEGYLRSEGHRPKDHQLDRSPFATLVTPFDLYIVLIIQLDHFLSAAPIIAI